MQNEGIRFRLYTYERFKRVKLLAEAIVMFAMVNLDEDMCKIVQLERAYVRIDRKKRHHHHVCIFSHQKIRIYLVVLIHNKIRLLVFQKNHLILFYLKLKLV